MVRNSAVGAANSTAVILCGLVTAGVILPTDSASDIFTVAAVAVGVSLGIATYIEATAGVRNLIRVDIVMLWVLYGLIFFEFLFTQPGIDEAVSPAAASTGTIAALLGFAGIVIGRQLVPRRFKIPPVLSQRNVPPGSVFALFLVAAFVGYLHILLAVNFDLFEMLRQMELPRFWQSWGRGKYGDAYSLLYELGMLIYLIPPIAGIVYARAKEFKASYKVIVTAVLVLTLYYGFASGTRNVFGTYVLTFAAVYFMTKPGITRGRVLVQGSLIMIFLIVAMTLMLEFRKVGFKQFEFSNSRYDTMFIDRNLVMISRITEVFPIPYEFLGLEIPYNALIRPIPRVLWPDKPEGLSTSIEAATGVGRGAQGTTVACTFVGEAYMAGGLFAVVLFSLIFGAAAAMWNRVVFKFSSPFAEILYASGFVCAVIAMRSMLSMVPLMLPTLALWCYGKFFWLQRAQPRGAPSIISRNKT
jgi:oligosaccharide repeat unit polymerase